MSAINYDYVPSARELDRPCYPIIDWDFAFESAIWSGSVATIVPTQGDHVWGTLWTIDLSNLPDIDRQEGVSQGIYEPRTVYVKLRGESESTPVRAYLLTKQPESNLYELPKDSIPLSRQPSKTYLQCLVKGAIESSVPEDYVLRLRSIKHNGQVNSDIERKLQLGGVAL
ncbi:GM14939 [Drosophila sechellia]|uniref:gamma-glutamylcyclotransferase n=1 Tax=Drosophila sechellia TaxID=7238 RepID=B4IFS0_DROSE|nr:GM14939 [Drosophila sechellia]